MGDAITPSSLMSIVTLWFIEIVEKLNFTVTWKMVINYGLKNPKAWYYMVIKKKQN